MWTLIGRRVYSKFTIRRNSFWMYVVSKSSQNTLRYQQNGTQIFKSLCTSTLDMPTRTTFWVWFLFITLFILLGMKNTSFSSYLWMKAAKGQTSFILEKFLAVFRVVQEHRDGYLKSHFSQAHTLAFELQLPRKNNPVVHYKKNLFRFSWQNGKLCDRLMPFSCHLIRFVSYRNITTVEEFIRPLFGDGMLQA